MSNATNSGIDGLTTPKVEHKPGERIDIKPIVERLRPLILESEEELENRRIPERLVDEMYDTGVFRALMPHEYGGLEMHAIDWLDLTYEISRLNGSVGWLAIIVAGGYPLVEDELMRELATGTRLLSAGSEGRIGSAVKVDGGYRVTGKWNFTSGSPFADYLTGAVYLVNEDDEPVLTDGDPTVLEVILKASETTIHDDWDGLGLRGTGSNAWETNDLFVEDRFVREPFDVAETFASRPLYMHFVQVLGYSSHALGLARGAIDSYIELANRPARRDSSRQSKLGKSQFDKISVARADALVCAAKAFSWETCERVYGGEFDATQYAEAEMEMKKANVFAVRGAKQAVDLVFERAGVDGVIRGRRLERQFRDIMTAAQHKANGEDSYEALGQYLITGEDPHKPLVDTAIGSGALAEDES